jgi:hypothetical protein
VIQFVRKLTASMLRRRDAVIRSLGGTPPEKDVDRRDVSISPLLRLRDGTLFAGRVYCPGLHEGDRIRVAGLGRFEAASVNVSSNGYQPGTYDCLFTCLERYGKDPDQ